MTETAPSLLLAGMLVVSVLAGAGATTVAAQDGRNATEGDELTDEGNATEGEDAPETADGEGPDPADGVDGAADENDTADTDPARDDEPASGGEATPESDDAEATGGQAASGEGASGPLDRLDATLPGPLASWVAGTLGVLVLVLVGLVAWRG